MPYASVFQTRSEIIACKNLSPPNACAVALDIGYSAVKGYSARNRFCFPSYVREHPAEIIGAPDAMDIFYRGENGVTYAVGSAALGSISSRDTNDDTTTLFGRNRYFSPSFLILARVGIALALGKETTPEKPIYLQTGLPPAYLKADTALLIQALSGPHAYAVKVGGGEWVNYAFNLSNISVIDQPIGSVYSATKRADGTTVLCPDNRTYIDHNLLVLDGGFGTLDVFSIMNRSINSSNTFNDLGMKSIFEKTANDIFAAYGKEVHVHTLQQYLTSGTVNVLDRRSHTAASRDFTEFLKKNTKKVFEQAITKIEAAYDDLADYEYLLVTGGTGAAWMDLLKERYQGMATLEIITGNQNEKMPPVYNNVRGYYIFRALNLLKS